MSSVTDPYQPIERRLRLTRRLLKILAGQRSPDAPPLLADPPKPKLVVQTRSPDIVRDCDLLRRIEENGGRAQVNMTVTTDDEEVRRTFEPSCPSNAARLRAIAEVREEGVAACVTMMPLLWASGAPRTATSSRICTTRSFPATAVAPSPAYADAFRNGAALFPQPLVVFDQPKSQARGVVYFRSGSTTRLAIAIGDWGNGWPLLLRHDGPTYPSAGCATASRAGRLPVRAILFGGKTAGACHAPLGREGGEHG